MLQLMRGPFGGPLVLGAASTRTLAMRHSSRGLWACPGRRPPLERLSSAAAVSSAAAIARARARSMVSMGSHEAAQRNGRLKGGATRA